MLGVLAGEDRFYTLARSGLDSVEAPDQGMSTVGSNEIAIKLAGKAPVRGIAPLAGEEPVVLAPARETL